MAGGQNYTDGSHRTTSAQTVLFFRLKKEYVELSRHIQITFEDLDVRILFYLMLEFHWHSTVSARSYLLKLKWFI